MILDRIQPGFLSSLYFIPMPPTNSYKYLCQTLKDLASTSFIDSKFHYKNK